MTNDLDNGFHPKRTHGRETALERTQRLILENSTYGKLGTRPHNRDGSRPFAYMPSDDYNRGCSDGFEMGFEYGSEQSGGLMALLIGAAFGFLGGAGMVAGWLVIFQ